MTPARISTPNTRQPTQSPKTDSSVAKTIISTRIASATVVQPRASAATAADTVHTAPMDWAKRFGGPGVGRGGPSRGATTSIARRARGLSVGPVSARATKP